MDEVLLKLAVADTVRRERAARGLFHKGDPYGRGRKSQRSRRYKDREHNVWCQPASRRATLKRMAAVIASRRVEAQQEIEQWLARRGVRWHQLARVLAREYGGDWRKIEDAMTRWGHVKGGANAA